MTELYDFDGLVRQVFIETGMGAGLTLRRAVDAGFREVHSIDVHEETFKLMAELFAMDENVKLYLGPSPEVLPRVIDRGKSTTFWLDAHWSGGSFMYDEENGDSPQCPLLDELAAITAVDWVVPPLVLIDDLHMFVDWPQETYDRGFRRDEWPMVADIDAALPGFRQTDDGERLTYRAA